MLIDKIQRYLDLLAPSENVNENGDCTLLRTQSFFESLHLTQYSKEQIKYIEIFAKKIEVSKKIFIFGRTGRSLPISGRCMNRRVTSIGVIADNGRIQLTGGRIARCQAFENGGNGDVKLTVLPDFHINTPCDQPSRNQLLRFKQPALLATRQTDESYVSNDEQPALDGCGGSTLSSIRFTASSPSIMIC